MRKVIFEIAMSMDGFIEGPDGDLDWVIPIFDLIEKEGAGQDGFLTHFDTIFYGRNAYERIGISCPMEMNVSETGQGFHTMFNVVRKYVFSRTAKHVAGNGMVIHDNLESEVRRIRGEEGKDIWFCGGANILKTFIDLDLVDEYMLAIQPVLLGSGKPLFHTLKSRLNVRLVEAQNLPSGVVILRYEPQIRNNRERYENRSV